MDPLCVCLTRNSPTYFYEQQQQPEYHGNNVMTAKIGTDVFVTVYVIKTKSRHVCHINQTDPQTVTIKDKSSLDY